MFDERIERSAAQIAADVNAGRISAREVAEATLAQVDAVEPRVGAYLTVLQAQALAHAARVDERVRAGERLPLAGVPLAVKDNMCLEGTRTTCAEQDPRRLDRSVHGDRRIAHAPSRSRTDRQGELR